MSSAGRRRALIAAGIEPGDRVGLLSENRVEWLIADMAILTAGAVTVSPHAPLTARQVQFQFADAGVRWIMVSDWEQLAKVELIRKELPNLRGVVVAFAVPRERRSLVGPFLQSGRRRLPSLEAEAAPPRAAARDRRTWRRSCTPRAPPAIPRE